MSEDKIIMPISGKRQKVELLQGLQIRLRNLNVNIEDIKQTINYAGLFSLDDDALQH